jgi:hypothetical protein
MKPAEVFLSHSDKDRAFATRVRDCLVAHGIPVWRENRDRPRFSARLGSVLCCYCL